MIKSCKKIICLFLIALLTFAVLTACGGINGDLKNALKNDLCSTSWWSGNVSWKDDNDSGLVRWIYVFNEDGTGCRTDSISYDAKEWEESEPWDIEYKFIKKNGVTYLHIETFASQEDYLLDYDEGSGRINSFKGLIQCRNDYTATYTRNGATEQYTETMGAE